MVVSSVNTEVIPLKSVSSTSETTLVCCAASQSDISASASPNVGANIVMSSVNAEETSVKAVLCDETNPLFTSMSEITPVRRTARSESKSRRSQSAKPYKRNISTSKSRSRVRETINNSTATGQPPTTQSETNHVVEM